MKGCNTNPVQIVGINAVFAYPMVTGDIDVCQYGLLPIQGGNSEALSCAAASYLVGIEAASPGS